MFYILLFFTFCHASFDQNLAIITQKPWLTSHLIKKSDLLQKLKLEDKELEKVIDYKVFDGKLYYIARTNGGIDNCGFIGGQMESICAGNQVHGPLLLDVGKYLLNGKVFTISGPNSSFVLDKDSCEVRDGIKLGNCFFL